MSYIDLVNQFIYKEPLVRTKLDGLGENDDWLKTHGWQDGTKALFLMASVPLGWTQVVSTNDKFLRVVSGAGGGVGGTVAPSANIVFTHTHPVTAQPNHTHTKTHSHRVNEEASPSTFIYNLGLVGSGDTVVEIYATTLPGGGGPGYAPTDILRPYTKSVIETTSAGGGHTHTIGSSGTDSKFAYVDIIVGQKDTSSGYTDMTSVFNHNTKVIFENFASLEANDEFNKNRLTPTSAVSLFSNSVAPVGWTRLTTLSDKALRIVSGAGAGGGGTGSIVGGINYSHTHSVSVASAHSHNSVAHRHDIEEFSGFDAEGTGDFVSVDGSNQLRQTDGTTVTKNVLKGRTANDGGGVATTSDDSHAHNILSGGGTLKLAYLDVIQCSKDSVGAAYPYQNLTGSSIFKKLVSKQKLNNFAKNDEYIRFHTIPSGSLTMFYQTTAPLSWTQITTVNDKCLRVTSGAGGGTGGSQGIGSTCSLVHSHYLYPDYHQHSGYHQHAWDVVSKTDAGNFGDYISVQMSGGGSTYYALRVSYISGTGGNKKALNGFSNSLEAYFNQLWHYHNGAENGGSVFTFAYADVIYCQKD